MTGFILSIIGSIIAGVTLTLSGQYINRIRKTKYLNRLLNFGTKKIYFLYQYKTQIAGASQIVPAISTEDFLAMNNFISALIKINWKYDNELLEVNRYFNQSINNQTNNVVSFGSSKINKFTKEVERILEFNELNFYRIEQVENSNHWAIVDNNGRYNSEVQKQLKEYKEKKKIETSFMGSQKFTDIAYITKVTNPWDSESKVIIMAGVKGIGTWGAAECIKKWSKKIYDKLPRGEKHKDFSVLMRVHYKKYDIISVDIIDIHVFEEKKLRLS